MNIVATRFYKVNAHISYPEDQHAALQVDNFLPSLVARLAGNLGFTSRAQLSQVAPNPTMAIYATSSPATSAQLLRFMLGVFGTGGVGTWRALEVEIVFYATASFVDTEIRWPLSTALMEAFADSRGTPPANMAGMLNSNSNPDVYNLEISTHNGLSSAQPQPPMYRGWLAERTTPTTLQLIRGFMPPRQAGGQGTPTGGPPAAGDGTSSSMGWVLGGVAVVAVVVYFATRDS